MSPLVMRHLVALYRRHPNVAPALFYGGLGACAAVGAGLAMVGALAVEDALQRFIRRLP
ncbi:MAG TPA: hypothetical protein VJ277_09665 [Gemmatimonadales bacterium]|nr:hypothetical protein [Gemmatimonadales bacterium]